MFEIEAPKLTPEPSGISTGWTEMGLMAIAIVNDLVEVLVVNVLLRVIVDYFLVVKFSLLLLDERFLKTEAERHIYPFSRGC